MKLYFYGKAPNHTSKNTDEMILHSLESFSGKPRQDFAVRRTPNGKPIVEGGEYFVGATHTDDLAIIAVDTESLGIDCEKADRCVKSPEKIAGKYFSDGERDYIFKDSDGTRLRFLEIWVKKEAYVKFLGGGVKDMKSFDVFSLDGEFERVRYENYIIYVYKER